MVSGCKHYDFDSEWVKVNIDDGYSYYLYETPNAIDDDPLFVTFPGFGGGYDDSIGNSLKRYLKETGKRGQIVCPLMNYKNQMEKELCKQAVIGLINSIKHKDLHLLGESAGGVFILELSNEVDASKLMPIVAGAYRDGGGYPTDELPFPGTYSIFFVNGYDKDIFEKYGLYWDGTVFVDPTVRLANEIGAKMLLVPGVSHSKGVKILDKVPSIFDWLMNDF